MLTYLEQVPQAELFSIYHFTNVDQSVIRGNTYTSADPDFTERLLDNFVTSHDREGNTFKFHPRHLHGFSQEVEYRINLIQRTKGFFPGCTTRFDIEDSDTENIFIEFPVSGGRAPAEKCVDALFLIGVTGSQGKKAILTMGNKYTIIVRFDQYRNIYDNEYFRGKRLLIEKLLKEHGAKNYSTLKKANMSGNFLNRDKGFVAAAAAAPASMAAAASSDPAAAAAIRANRFIADPSQFGLVPHVLAAPSVPSPLPAFQLGGSNWFERLFGFKEDYSKIINVVRSPGENVQLTSTRPFHYDHSTNVLSCINGKQVQCGKFVPAHVGELVSAAKQKIAEHGLSKEGSRALKMSVSLGDVSALQENNPYCTFQVASQFNCLEFPSYNTVPEEGITVYQSDRTQGPACSIGAAGATFYRNYVVPVDGQLGQSANKQLNMLKDLADSLENSRDNVYLQNGYTVNVRDRPRFDGLNQEIQSKSEGEKNELASLLKLGVHSGVQVTNTGFGSREVQLQNPIIINQVFASGCSIAYSKIPGDKWTEFAKLVQRGAALGTLASAIANNDYSKRATPKVFFTLLGAGVFGNDLEWVFEAITNACEMMKDVDAELSIVCYQRDPKVDVFVAAFNQKQDRERGMKPVQPLSLSNPFVRGIPAAPGGVPAAAAVIAQNPFQQTDLYPAFVPSSQPFVPSFQPAPFVPSFQPAAPFVPSFQPAAAPVPSEPFAQTRETHDLPNYKMIRIGNSTSIQSKSDSSPTLESVLRVLFTLERYSIDIDTFVLTPMNMNVKVSISEKDIFDELVGLLSKATQRSVMPSTDLYNTIALIVHSKFYGEKISLWEAIRVFSTFPTFNPDDSKKLLKVISCWQNIN